MIVNVRELKQRINPFSAAWYQATHGLAPDRGPVVGDHWCKAAIKISRGKLD